jgi:hypothetical protein
MFMNARCQKHSSIDARDNLALMLGIGFAIIGQVIIMSAWWIFATPAYADARGSAPRTFFGSIAGYIVTIDVQDPIGVVDGFYNVTLCPPTSLVLCKGGIYGFRTTSSGDDWLEVRTLPASSSTPRDRTDPRKRLDEAMRAVCYPNPACREGGGQEV